MTSKNVCLKDYCVKGSTFFLLKMRDLVLYFGLAHVFLLDLFKKRVYGAIGLFSLWSSLCLKGCNIFLEVRGVADSMFCFVCFDLET